MTSLDKKGSKFFWRQIMKFKIILKGEESAFVPWEVSKKNQSKM